MFDPGGLERLLPSIEEAEPKERYLSELDKMPPVAPEKTIGPVAKRHTAVREKHMSNLSHEADFGPQGDLIEKIGFQGTYLSGDSTGLAWSDPNNNKGKGGKEHA